MTIQSRRNPGEAYHLGSLQALEVDLDPRFLADREAVPIELADGTLTVGMVRPDDTATIDALKFATGWDIQPRPMGEAEVAARLAALPLAGKNSAPQQVSGATSAPHIGTRSLGEKLTGWMRAGPGSDAPLGGLARLLDAGYSPVEAAAVLLAADAPGADESDRAAAMRLQHGEDLALAVQVAPVPTWIGTALLATPAAARPRTLVDLVAADRVLMRRSLEGRLLALELIGWGVPALASWLLLSWAGFAVVIAGCAYLTAALRSLTSPQPHQNLSRAGVLEIVAILCEHHAAEPAAISSGLARLSAAVPTWGRVPDDRAGLATALSLDSIGTAALMRGSLAVAARREAAECADRTGQAIARVRWLIRCAGMLALGLATALLLA